ncbi:filamentous hemagglutinin N-terminal domain-containing protein [Desulfobacterales bacterium HSG2]|nr:filamentous hemagglutinin N-terminal domain-containing protein [Desulfobacterales bacterium HSG2]
MKFALQSAIIIFVLAITAIPVHSDGMHPRGIQLDGSVGNAGKLNLPGPDYDIRAEYGQQAGTNLFHSFHRFNIHSDETATFSGPPSLQNIISRVTGGDSSWIDGQLRSDIAGADMYLLNPAGVMFGPNASLDLGGSLHVSTADYLRLGESDRFYAVPHANDVLSVAAPAAFGFLDSDVAPISAEGKGELTTEVWGEAYDNWDDWLEENPAGLAVPEGETISLTGGDIEITKGTHAPYEDEYGNPYTSAGANLSAPEGEIRIASVTSPGEVETGSQVSGFKFQVSKGGNIKISDKSVADVSGDRGGSIFIRGGRFEMTDSKVTSYTRGDQDGGVIEIQADHSDVRNSEIVADTEGAGKGGDIVLTSADTLKVSNTLVYAGSLDEQNGGDAGNIEIEARQTTLTEGAFVSSSTYGPGQGGDIVIKAADTLMISGQNEAGDRTVISSDSGDKVTSAEGNAGRIAIEAGQIILTDGAFVSSDTYGPGQGGDIVIKAADTLMISGRNEAGNGTIISSDSGGNETRAEGNAGRIEIEAGQITLTDGASVRSNTYGPGNAGHIETEARQMELKDNSQINVSTWGHGEGGTVTVKVADTLTFSEGSEDETQGGILANSNFKEGDGGSAGNIKIDAREITITDWLEISSTTWGHGKGGTITVSADDTLEISASDTSLFFITTCGIFTRSNGISPESGSGADMDISAATVTLSGKAAISASTEGGGDAGDIRLTSDQLELDNGASVFSASHSEENAGEAGTITVNATDSVRLTENSALTTEAEGAGGGKIFVNAGDKIYLLNGRITSSVKQGEGKGGDVTTNSEFVILNHGDITANAEEGDGGAIFIVTDNYLKSSDSEVTATSARGNDGTVRIEAPDADISSELVILPETFIDAAKWMKTPCAARSGEKTSRFVIKGRDAASTVFDGWQPSPLLWLENRDKE